MAVGSFSAGLSGLNANSVYLSVIGNNLANINTIGFKASSVTFMDLVSQTVGGSSANPMQVGLGVVTGSISPVFSQGAIENTKEATNVAIQGGGFFVVANDAGTAYTRAGNFSFDNNGTLVTPDGYQVQGWTQTDSNGHVVTTAQPGDITVPPGVLHAHEPRLGRRHRLHLHDLRADLRRARPVAPDDRELHEHGARRVGLGDDRGGRGSDGRHRGYALHARGRHVVVRQHRRVDGRDADEPGDRGR
jgi:flagellar hook-associated protein FlgK